MGYEIFDAPSSVIISLKNSESVIKILQNYTKVFSSDDIVHLFTKARYESFINIKTEEIHVTNIIHQFKWHYDEEKLWKDLSPYIKSNTFISWFAEDGDIWRYAFVNKEFIVEYAKDIFYMHRYDIITLLKEANIPEASKFIKNIDWII
jgi:hypothetical protein